QVQRLRAFDPAQSEISERPRCRIDEQRIPVSVSNRKIAERALQSLRQCDTTDGRILDLLEPGEVVHDAARLFRYRTHALRKVANGHGCTARELIPCRCGSGDGQRSPGRETEDAAQLPTFNYTRNPARSILEERTTRAKRQFIRSVAAEIVCPMEA